MPNRLPGEEVERRQGQQVEDEAARLGDADRRLERLTRVRCRPAETQRADVGVQRRRPVVEHSLALADPGIVGEEALDVVLDRPLAAEDRRGHFQVMAAIAGNQRQVPAADPDRRPDRVADPEDRQPAPAVPAQASTHRQPEHQQRRADRQVPADQDELGRPADPRQHGDLVELVRDEVERRRDPAGPPVGPGRGHGRARHHQTEDAPPPLASVSSRALPLGGPGSGARTGLTGRHRLPALSMASRRARNSLSGFHSGKRSPSATR